MSLEQMEDDYRYDELRFKKEYDGELVFIHISREACEDNFGSEINDDQKHRLEEIADEKFAANDLVERVDKVNVPVKAVLITNSDL